MRKISLIGLLLIAFSILFSQTVLAENKTKTVIIPKLPVFMAGKYQVVDKPIDGDLMISGNQVKIDTTVNGDVYAAGEQVDVGGTINGNLIVAGGTVTIVGKVNKNIIMAGGQVIIENSANVGGYVLAAGKEVDLRGNFSGPVKVGAGNLVIGDKAVISGNLEADVTKSDISTSAKIVGEKKIQIHEIKQPEKQKDLWREFGLAKEVFSFVGKLVVLLVLVKLFGEGIRQAASGHSFWSTTGLGLIFLIVTPFLALILIMTIVGIPLALITGVIYLVSLYLSGMATSIYIGNCISSKGYLKTNNLYVLAVVGLVLLTLLGLIPLVGGLIKFVALILGLGILFRKIARA